MSFWKKVGKVAQASVPVVIAATMPESLANTVAMAGVKHATKINNQAIPAVNLVTSFAMTYIPKVIDTGDWISPIVPALHEGGLLAAASTAIHQSTKIALADTVKFSL